MTWTHVLDNFLINYKEISEKSKSEKKAFGILPKKNNQDSKDR